MSRSSLSLLFALAALTTAAVSGADARTSVVPSHYGTVHGESGVISLRPLPFYYDLYTFRGRGGSTAIVTAFAVEAGRLETEAANSRTRYRFSVTLVLADTAIGSVSNTHDTVYVDVARPLDDDHLLFTHVEVPAPPSASTHQRVIMTDATTPGIGQLYSERFPIPDYSGSQLMLSDIALGQPDARAGWQRGDVTLALLPTSRLPSSAFDVYYEIYNLAPARDYATDIVIEHDATSERGRAVERKPVRLRFLGKSESGRERTQAELRRVETSLPRGRYRMTITITDLVSRRSVSRSRAFEVGGPANVTMVPALPPATRR
ncbi:MAG TPA: hypothetical protein VK933_08490 [Longimicrobiales bacterium]|nr:hypothetical protein [Longimicrobiales bacterium]